MKLRFLFPLLLLCGSAQAQQFSMPPPAGVVVMGIRVVSACGGESYTANSSPAFGEMDTTGKFCVAATVNASITGFPGTSQTTGTPITVTTSATAGTLPAGTEVVVSNIGPTNTAMCKLGNSATTSDQPIPPNSWFGFTVGSATQIACVTSASGTTVNLVGGSGLPTGAGGGGGGSGGAASTVNPTTPANWGIGATGAAVPANAVYLGITSGGNLTGWNGAITAASGAVAAGAITSGAAVDGSDVTQGATAASACGTDTGTCSIVQLMKRLNTLVDSAITSGTNYIGNIRPMSQYPATAIPITSSAAGTTGALTVGLSPTVVGNTAYICNLSVRSNATAVATGTNGLVGLISGTMSFAHWTSTLSGIGITEEVWNPCIPASGQNVQITLTTAAPGSGGTITAALAGYQIVGNGY